MEDEEIKLSDDTLQILNQFLKEREEAQSQEVTEDWNLSQFW